MKTRLFSTLVFFVSFLFIGAAASYAQITFTLKDGGTLSAYSCNDYGATLVCTGESGMFEVDKNDIKSMKEEGVEEPPAAVGGAGAAPGPSKEDIAEQRKRFEQIRQRKIEIQAERDRLHAKREQLRQDVNKAEKASYITQAEVDALNRQNAAIEEEIKRYNEEVQRLNAEEKAILESLQ